MKPIVLVPGLMCSALEAVDVITNDAKQVWIPKLHPGMQDDFIRFLWGEYDQ